MKYLRSLMQQSVTACKNQAKLIQQFTLSLLYLLIIHIVALLFFFLFRLVLFTSIIRKTKCFDFWERNVLFPKTKRSFFRTPTLPFSA